MRQAQGKAHGHQGPLKLVHVSDVLQTLSFGIRAGSVLVTLTGPCVVGNVAIVVCC